MNKADIKKILVISLSNIGDIVLTFPVIDVLKRDFPDARLDVVIGPKGESLLKGNPLINRLYLYRKRQPGLLMLRWMIELRRERYDLVVDLRHTAIPFLIAPRYRTALLQVRKKDQHMRLQHLGRLNAIYPFSAAPPEKIAIFISEEDRAFIDCRIRNKIPADKSLIVVSPGAAAGNKRWPEEGFAKICDVLVERHGAAIVFVGDGNDTPVVGRIASRMQHPALDLSGQTTLTQLAYLLSLCSLVVTNDSAPMHIASYGNAPVVALFGPTDPAKYGPWSSMSFIVKKENACPVCAGMSGADEHQCLRSLTVEDVLKVMQPLFSGVMNAARP